MRWASLAFFLVLTSCGVIWPYAYDARDVEEQLSIAMSKDQVSKTLGKPAPVMQHDDQNDCVGVLAVPERTLGRLFTPLPLSPVLLHPRRASQSLLRGFSKGSRLSLGNTRPRPDVDRAGLYSGRHFANGT